MGNKRRFERGDEGDFMIELMYFHLNSITVDKLINKICSGGSGGSGGSVYDCAKFIRFRYYKSALYDFVYFIIHIIFKDAARSLAYFYRSQS